MKSFKQYINTTKETKEIKKESKVLSKVLFKLDPLNTSCKENDAVDEYDKTAYKIIEFFHVYEIQNSKDVRTKFIKEVLREECVLDAFIELHDKLLAHDVVLKILKEYDNAKNSSAKAIS